MFSLVHSPTLIPDFTLTLSSCFVSSSICLSLAVSCSRNWAFSSSYFAGDAPLREAILASCAATRVFTSSSSITTQLSASVVLRYFLPPPGFLV